MCQKPKILLITSNIFCYFSYFKFLTFSSRSKAGNAALYSALYDSHEDPAAEPVTSAASFRGDVFGRGGSPRQPDECMSSLDGLTDEIFTGAPTKSSSATQIRMTSQTKSSSNLSTMSPGRMTQRIIPESSREILAAQRGDHSLASMGIVSLSSEAVSSFDSLPSSRSKQLDPIQHTSNAKRLFADASTSAGASPKPTSRLISEESDSDPRQRSRTMDVVSTAKQTDLVDEDRTMTLKANTSLSHSPNNDKIPLLPNDGGSKKSDKVVWSSETFITSSERGDDLMIDSSSEKGGTNISWSGVGGGAVRPKTTSNLIQGGPTCKKKTSTSESPKYVACFAYNSPIFKIFFSSS